MGQLHHNGGRHHSRGVRVTELRGKKHQERAEPFATRLGKVPRRLHYEWNVTLRGLGQAFLDSTHSSSDIGLKGIIQNGQPEGPDDSHRRHSCR